MANMARWQATIVDGFGNVIPGAVITVRNQNIGGLPLASIFSDRAGTSGQANPFNSDANGYAAFHVAGGSYRITAVSGSFSRQWDYVDIGTARELDIGDFVFSSEVRKVITATRNYYVRVDGSDSNDGLANTVGGAFQTIQKAASVAALLDGAAGFNVSINIAAGTFAEQVVPRPITAGNITFVGAGATTIIDPPAGVNHCFNFTAGGRFTVSSMTLRKTTATTGHGFFVQNYSLVNFTAITFGAMSGNGRHIYCNSNGCAVAIGNYTITGAAYLHWSVTTGGYIIVVNMTVTLTGTPAFTLAFAQSFLPSGIQCNGTTFSGSATGKRFDVSGMGSIYTGGGGANFIPGNSAGTAVPTDAYS